MRMVARDRRVWSERGAPDWDRRSGLGLQIGPGRDQIIRPGPTRSTCCIAMSDTGLPVGYNADRTGPGDPLILQKSH